MSSAIFRIWFKVSKKMSTSPDDFINTHGRVYSMEHNGEMTWHSAVVMRKTGYETPNGRMLYELDIVSCDGEYGIVFYSYYAFKVYFIESGDSEWLGTLALDERKLEWVIDYFHARLSSEYQELVGGIPCTVLAESGIYKTQNSNKQFRIKGTLKREIRNVLKELGTCDYIKLMDHLPSVDLKDIVIACAELEEEGLIEEVPEKESDSTG